MLTSGQRTESALASNSNESTVDSPQLIVHRRPSTVPSQPSIINYRLTTADYRLKTLFTVLISIVTFVRCNYDRTLTEQPPQLLSKQQMVSFLIDLHLTEAKMNYTEVRQPDSTEILFRNYEKYLMEEHGFTDSVYLESYAYYLDHMELMDEIYEEVVDSLNVMSTLEKAREEGAASDTL